MLVCIFHVVSYDIWFYISHRLLHTPYLYTLHKIHHEKMIPVWQDTYHGHWFESPFQSVGFLLPLLVFPLDTSQMLVAFLICQTRGIMRHDKRTAFIDGGHHMRHHLNGSCNYGEEWIDWLFNTQGILNTQGTSQGS